MLESLRITSKAAPFVVDFRSAQVVRGSMWCWTGRDIGELAVVCVKHGRAVYRASGNGCVLFLCGPAVSRLFGLSLVCGRIQKPIMAAASLFRPGALPAVMVFSLRNVGLGFASGPAVVSGRWHLVCFR